MDASRGGAHAGGAALLRAQRQRHGGGQNDAHDELLLLRYAYACVCLSCCMRVCMEVRLLAGEGTREESKWLLPSR